MVSYFCGLTMNRVLFIIAFIIVSSPSFAQILPNFGEQRAGLSTLSFLKNELNPRTTGISGAGVALAGDPYSSQNNIAGLASLETNTIAISNLSFASGIQQSMGSFTLKTLGESRWNFTINSLNSGQQEERTEFKPNGTGRYFSVNNTAISLNYAKPLTDRFSLGIGLKYIYEAVAEFRNHTAAVDIGFLYSTDFKDLKFAVFLQNFGGNSALNQQNIPVDFNRTDITTSSYTVPTIFKMGASIKLYEEEKHKLIGAIQLNHPNDNSENINLGFEYDFAQLLQARIGYRLGLRGYSFPSLGVGIRPKITGGIFKFDYGIALTNHFGALHNFGISYQFKKK